MDDIFWLFMLFPLIWPMIARRLWHTDITWAEMSLNMAVVIVLSAAIWFGGKYQNLQDVEIWSGQVTGKARVEVSCEHSYQCYCVTVSCGKNCTTESCQTCYEHSYDVDWRVYTDVQNLNIDRIDRRGLGTPSRWTAVQIGEPVALPRSYTNYVKAASHSLFVEDAELAKKFKDQIPEYPKVYDYYRVNRIQTIGVEVDDLATWNWKLNEIMKTLGPEKQVNINLLLVDNPSEQYAFGLKSAWQGFKKNDVVITVGTPNYPEITWVHVDSWSKQDIVNVRLRDEIRGMKTVDLAQILKIIQREVGVNFERRPMKEFEYLKETIDPPLWVLIFVAIVAFGVSPALTWYMSRPGVDFRFPFEKRPGRWN